MADRFYTPDLLAPGEFVLRGDDAHHLTTVRRFAPGDRVTLFNGDGCEYPAEVVAAGKNQAVLTVLSCEHVNREPPFPVVIGSALPKGDRADYLIEKLVEVGATLFVPLFTARSVVQPKGSKSDKLKRAVVEASKQCGRNVLMSVEPPAKLTDFFSRADLPPHRFLLHTAETGVSSQNHLESLRGHGVVFAIGPEGGFSPEEVSVAVSVGWNPLSFGPRVLRVETAAVIAAAWAAQG